MHEGGARRVIDVAHRRLGTRTRCLLIRRLLLTYMSTIDVFVHRHRTDVFTSSSVQRLRS